MATEVSRAQKTLNLGSILLKISDLINLLVNCRYSFMERFAGV